MKSDIHPESYRPVVFKDSASGFSFLSKSCARTTQTVKWEDGQEYPLVILGISSASHPFYTGQQVFVDTAGRVDKFQQRLAKTKEAHVAYEKLLSKFLKEKKAAYKSSQAQSTEKAAATPAPKATPKAEPKKEAPAKKPEAKTAKPAGKTKK